MWSGIAQFRKSFPEFSDIVRYPDAQIDFWSKLAIAQVNENAWRNQTLTGVSLYIAHEITISAQNAKASAAGGAPGGQSGPVNSKTVGSVTVAYDTQAAIEKDSGHWNLTIYGRQFIRLARIFGAGAVQL